jgi:hypothetical protein
LTQLAKDTEIEVWKQANSVEIAEKLGGVGVFAPKIVTKRFAGVSERRKMQHHQFWKCIKSPLN